MFDFIYSFRVISANGWCVSNFQHQARVEFVANTLIRLFSYFTLADLNLLR